MENKVLTLEELLTNQGFLKELFVEDISKEEYNHLNLLYDLLNDTKDIDLEHFKLFKDGYVAKLIKTRLESINNIENLILEINKLSLLANKLPLEISLEFFGSDEMIENLLLLDNQQINTIFQNSNPYLITLLSNIFLNRYKEVKKATNLTKKEYNYILDQIVFKRKKDIENMVDLKAESSRYSDLLKKQSKLEAKCLDYVTVLNNICLEYFEKQYINEDDIKHHI